jgi:hypothetical protein
MQERRLITCNTQYIDLKDHCQHRRGWWQLTHRLYQGLTVFLLPGCCQLPVVMHW